MQYLVGIDIGSTCAKTIVMNRKREIVHRFMQPTGWSSVDTAQQIEKRLLKLGVEKDHAGIVATGYGRVSVPYADQCVTEITCHGKGACFLYGARDLMVVDIGGQDTKIIALEAGAVMDFSMNDKCSAGTGRFLEVMANTLSLRPGELCEMASLGGGTAISSMCTVFAESEVISLIGRGEQKENIAYAVMDSIVSKVASQAARFQLQGKTVCLTGGLCGFENLRQALSKKLGVDVAAHEEGRYAGAVGAALCANAFAQQKAASE